MLRRKVRLTKFRLFKGPLPAKHVILYTFILFVGASLLSLWLVDRAIEPVIVSVAQKEIRRVAAEVINESLHENISKEIPNEEDIVLAHYQEGDPAPTYGFNPKLYGAVREQTLKDIQAKLGISEENPFENNVRDLDKDQLKSIVYYVPLGVVTGMSVLANFGPKIPVEMAIVGHVEMEYETKMTNPGINNTYLELFARVSVNLQIVIPSFEEETPVEQVVNLGGRYIPGKVPNFYGADGNMTAPALIEQNGKKK